MRAMTMWDPDGIGPLPSVLVVGGAFTLAGTVVANSIATYDAATGVWSPLGSGIIGGVYALTTMPNGDLVAGGVFLTAGGVSANNIARWNGTNWSPLGSGMSGYVTYSGPTTVSALVVLPNGDLVAGGEFTTAGGVSANLIARWDGSSWSSFGSGMTGNSVLALTTLPNGDLVAGGGFIISPGGWGGIARWNGSSWSPLGTGFGGVTALAKLPNGDLVAAGGFTYPGGPGVGRWNGSSWSPLGSGIGPLPPFVSTSPRVNALTTMPNGDVVAGGTFTTAGGVSANYIARWSGSGWWAMGSGMAGGTQPYVYALATLPNGDVVAGGGFTFAGNSGHHYIARWNGLNWSRLAPGLNGHVLALTTLPNGDVVAGGSFSTYGWNIARWNGGSWVPLGSGINTDVKALTAIPNGDVVAGGIFLGAGSVSAINIARFSGSSWSPLGSGMDMPGFVHALITMPNGDVVAGGQFITAGGVSASRIARWNGISWSPLGSGMSGYVYALTAMPNGDLVAGGWFGVAGGVSANHIARWNGTSWSALGSGIGGVSSPSVRALAVLPNGDLVAGGEFTTAGGVSANRIARWNGISWSPLGSGMSSTVTALATLPNGDVVVGGGFSTAGGVSASRIARWNGTSWSPLGSGMNNWVRALTTLPNGDVVAGGEFTTAGGLTSVYIARLTTTCPASVASLGAGCAGGGGNLSLTALSLPWLGATFRSRATGFAANALALEVLGHASLSIPLAAILPEGLPGCTLTATPDLLNVHVPAAGTVDCALPLPNTMAFAGSALYQQVVALEMSPTLAIQALASTNGLHVVKGWF